MVLRGQWLEVVFKKALSFNIVVLFFSVPLPLGQKSKSSGSCPVGYVSMGIFSMEDNVVNVLTLWLTGQGGVKGKGSQQLFFFELSRILKFESLSDQ